MKFLTNLRSFCKANRGKVPSRFGECPLNLGPSALFSGVPPLPFGPSGAPGDGMGQGMLSLSEKNAN